MSPAFAIAALVVITLLGGLILFIFRPIHRVNRLRARAVEELDAGHFDEAEQCYLKIFRLCQRICDPDQKAAIEFSVERGLGFCCTHHADFEAAERHFARAMKLLDKGMTQERSVIASLLAASAIAYHAQGKVEQSEQALNRLGQLCDAADESEAVTGVKLFLVAADVSTLQNLQGVAFRIARMGQSVLERTPVWHDAPTAHLKVSLAAYYMMRCEYSEARKLIQSALETAGEEFDSDDIQSASSTLGWVYVFSGHPEKAIKSFERSLEILTDEYGEDDWHTSVALSALSVAYSVRGVYNVAKRFSDQAWSIQFQQLPVNDSVRANTATNRALLLVDLGEFEEADQLLTEAAHVAEARANRADLAIVRLFQGISADVRLQHHRADEFLQEARILAEDTYGAGHCKTWQYLAILASGWIRLERYGDAEEMLIQALSIRESMADNNGINLANLYSILAELYVATERLPEAESNIFRVQELIDGGVSETHLMHADIHETLGRIRHAQSNFENAIEHFRKAVVVRDHVQPADHPRRVPLLDAYARSLESIGETALAEERRETAAKIRSKFGIEK